MGGKVCGACFFWKRDTNTYLYGGCNNTKFVNNLPPETKQNCEIIFQGQTDALFYDSDCPGIALWVGANFGCIHWMSYIEGIKNATQTISN